MEHSIKLIASEINRLNHDFHQNENNSARSVEHETLVNSLEKSLELLNRNQLIQESINETLNSHPGFIKGLEYMHDKIKRFKPYDI